MISNFFSFFWGLLIAILGGLIGLGGAEFRLPVLSSWFKIQTLQAIIVNLVVSAFTVAFSFIFRSNLTTLTSIGANVDIILNILLGSLLGASMGVSFASKISESTLTKLVVGFLFALSLLLILHNTLFGLSLAPLHPAVKIIAGFVAGVVIGVFSSMLGVAGGEMIIPTIVFVFSKDIKLAGSLSLAISFPTILIGLFRYYQQRKLVQIKPYKGLIAFMAAGSFFGAMLGSYLLKYISNTYLYLLLGVILLLSAFKLLSSNHIRKAGE